MYWTDWASPAKIERSHMDGNNRIAIVTRDIAWPNGITIDFAGSKIYWTDARLDVIKQAGLAGENPRVRLEL